MRKGKVRMIFWRSRRRERSGRKLRQRCSAGSGDENAGIRIRTHGEDAIWSQGRISRGATCGSPNLSKLCASHICFSFDISDSGIEGRCVDLHIPMYRYLMPCEYTYLSYMLMCVTFIRVQCEHRCVHHLYHHRALQLGPKPIETKQLEYCYAL